LIPQVFSPGKQTPALTLPLPNLAEGEDARIEALKKLHRILGRALADSRLHIETTNRKKSAGVFSVGLEGEDYLQFMSAILVGVIFAGLKTPEELVAVLEKNIARSKKPEPSIWKQVATCHRLPAPASQVGVFL
jgi:hypothetical protein